MVFNIYNILKHIYLKINYIYMNNDDGIEVHYGAYAEVKTTLDECQKK